MSSSRRCITIAGYCSGPEFGSYGRDRHRVLLNILFEELHPPEGYGQVRPKFHWEIEGSFAEKPLKPGGTRMALYLADGMASVSMNIPLSVTTSPEPEFAHYVVETMRAAANKLVAFLAKKQVEFRAEVYLDVVERALAEYKRKWPYANPGV